MDRLEFYRAAVSNIGLASTVRLVLEKRFGLSRPMRLTSRMLDFPVNARRGTSDLKVFHQIFTLREYRCLDGLKLNGLIVDLGANVGYSSAYFLSRFRQASVVAIEPDEANYNILVENLKPYGDRFSAIQAAIWPGAESVNLDRSLGEEWGFTVLPSKNGAIRTIDIPAILSGSGYDRISLLKIDIEGAEKQLFEADTSWLDQVDNIVIELHDEEARKIFFSKIDTSYFIISTCDELTVCLSR